MTRNNGFMMCAALAITAGATAFPAMAKPSRAVVVTAPADLVVRRASSRGLDLASAAGLRTLHYRVGGAVDALCAEVTGGRDGSADIAAAMKGCDNKGWDQARPQIARAVQRAHALAATGASAIGATAITISLGR